MTLRYSATLTPAEAREFMPFMQSLVGVANAVIRPLFMTGTAVISKADASPVTQADRGAEAALRRAIEARYPDHAIVGEEWGEKDGSAYRWVLDPVDGTRAFISHCFLFGTLIALERWVDDERGAGFRPVLGCISHPAAGLAVLGHAGAATLYAADGSTRPVAMRPCDRIEDATVLLTSLPGLGEQVAPRLQHVPALLARARLARTWGDCFGYFALATGGADVMLDPKLAYWDVAAIVPVIEGAGGLVTSWDSC
jgi:histidinol phosphatase-like enzyme (inositol monophosphatase family)